jgi:hypothetical protein
VLGSTFICEQQPQQLQRIVADSEAINDFAYIELDRLLTLDFEICLQGIGLQWHVGEPVVLAQDETGGMVIVKVLPEALEYVFAHKDKFALDMLDDLNVLETFVRGNDIYAIYEFSNY